MKVGFTGTREGLTGEQAVKLTEILLRKFKDEMHNTFHHGGCRGADTQAGTIAAEILCTFQQLRGWGWNEVIHPAIEAGERRGLKLFYQIIREPKPYLERNKDIVDETDWLIACPKSEEEEQRSGTWATVRYARKQKKDILMIYPGGEIYEEPAL